MVNQIISYVVGIDNRKKAVIVVIGLFMIVTTFHIAFYAASFEKEGSTALSWPYALGVDLAIIACSFFTRWQITKAPAWAGYFVCTLMSGIMNIGWIEPGWNPAAISYAIFPTIAMSLLGWLFRQVDKLPAKAMPAKSQQEPAFKKLEPIESEIVPAIPAFLCQECEKEFATVQALNAHKRFCASKISINGHQKEL